MELKTVKIEIPEGCNIILGQTHFIKSAEDIYEAMLNSVPGAKFGLGFCEASGPCLVRCEGTDSELTKIAGEKALEIGAGHSFIVYMRDAYPINVLNAIKNLPEVCNIYCATANPVEVLLAETGQGRGIVGVVDGFSSKEIESDKEVKERRELLRKISYKLH